MNALHDDIRQAFGPAEAAMRSVRPLEKRRIACYFALIASDLAALIAGFGIPGFLYQARPGLAEGLGIAWLIVPFFVTIALYNGAYSLATLERHRLGARRAIFAMLIALAALIFFAFYAKASNHYSRVVLTSGGVVAATLLYWGRNAMRGFVRWRCGDRVTRSLVIDDGGPAVDHPGADRIETARAGLSATLDDPAMLARIGLLLRDADTVLVSCPSERRALWSIILKSANVTGAVIDDTVLKLGAKSAHVEAGHGWLRVSVGPLGLRARGTKRLFDVAASGLGLVLLSPLLLVVAAAIKLEDRGPVLFRQQRVGRSNHFFTMLKFRSMKADACDRHGHSSVSAADPRVTRVGRFIRRTSIDELPQLLNVLRGDMSIVGPRPHALASMAGDKLFWEIDGRYWQRHALRPGLTGLAQVRGLRGSTAVEDDLSARLAADLEYVDGWSLWRDLEIAWATLRVLVHERAY